MRAAPRQNAAGRLALTKSKPRVHHRFGDHRTALATTHKPQTESPANPPQPRALLARPEQARARPRRRSRRAAARARQVLQRSSRRTSTSSSWSASPGLLDQVVARVDVRSPDGRTPQQALAEVRDRVLELTAAQSRLWRERARARRSPARASSSAPSTTPPRTSCASSKAMFAQPDLPGADAARGRARAAVPVHLRALAPPRRHRARPGHGRGALRAGEGARGAAALRRRSARAGC